MERVSRPDRGPAGPAAVRPGLPPTACSLPSSGVSRVPTRRHRAAENTWRSVLPSCRLTPATSPLIPERRPSPMPPWPVTTWGTGGCGISLLASSWFCVQKGQGEAWETLFPPLPALLGRGKFQTLLYARSALWSPGAIPNSYLHHPADTHVHMHANTHTHACKHTCACTLAHVQMYTQAHAHTQRD